MRTYEAMCTVGDVGDGMGDEQEGNRPMVFFGQAGSFISVRDGRLHANRFRLASTSSRSRIAQLDLSARSKWYDSCRIAML